MEHKFNPGRITITAAAMDTLSAIDLAGAMIRHLKGDWGNVCEEDRRLNETSLRAKFRLVSVYTTANGTKFGIVTEAGDTKTTVLLPGDC